MTGLVVIGTSSGGPTALRTLVSALPADFPLAVLVVLHVGARPSVLPSILSKSSKLPVTHAADRESIVPGHIYVAPPDHHLLVADGRLELDHGPRENYTPPAIPPSCPTPARPPTIPLSPLHPPPPVP